MSAEIHCFLSVAGPSNVVADFHATFMRARKFWPTKGWNWAFGLCAPDGVEPIVNDPAVIAEERPPGEAYMMFTGIWLGRHWDEHDVALTMDTVSSLWPALSIYFDGRPHYEGQKGVRGLWNNGECIVCEFRADEDSPFYTDDGDTFTSYRRYCPTVERPVPPFYQRAFADDDSPPSWDEIRRTIAASA